MFKHWIATSLYFASQKPKSKYIYVLRITEFKSTTFLELNVSLLRCKWEEALIQLPDNGVTKTTSVCPPGIMFFQQAITGKFRTENVEMHVKN